MARAQCIKLCKHKSRASVTVMLISNIRMGKKYDLCDFDSCMVVGAGWAGISISETADLVVFSHTAVSEVHQEWCKKTKNSLFRGSAN